MFLNALDDDRSDNDENEYNQEQAEYATIKAKQIAVDAGSKVANGKSTSADNHRDKLTNRMPNGKKA